MRAKLLRWAVLGTGLVFALGLGSCGGLTQMAGIGAAALALLGSGGSTATSGG